MNKHTRAKNRHGTEELKGNNIKIEALKLGIKLQRQQCGAVQLKKGGWMQLADEGTPDYEGYVVATGQHVVIEDKEHYEVIKPLQLEHIREVHAVGGLAGVCVTLEDLIDIAAGKLVI